MKYLIVTPEYETYYGDYEPPEYGCDVVEVEASTKREAKVLGLRELRRTGSKWILDGASDEHNPFTGLKVYNAEEEPK